MKTILKEGGPREGEGPSIDPIEAEIGPDRDTAYGDAYQGIEFLNDAIRMEDQIQQALEAADRINKKT